MGAFSSVLSRTAGAFDRALSTSITRRSPSAKSQSKAERLGHEERLRALDAIAKVYAPFIGDDERFFGPPTIRALRVDARATWQSASKWGGEVYDQLDVRWPSRTQTAVPELFERFHATVENREAAARIFRPRNKIGPRPFAILIHGYRAGQWSIEQRVWPIGWLLRRGFDVALYVLPFHAVRAERGTARFPSSDPRFTNEGFRQAIGDLRDLTATARREGAPHVIALGMSLGGYTTSLLATTATKGAEIDFAGPIIPLASFADIALENERLVGSAEEQRLQHAALARAHEIIDPTARAPKIDPRRVIVSGAEGDQICPVSHAEKLARHFSGDLVRFTGGHILQIGRRQAFRAIGARLDELGIGERGRSE